MDNDEKGLIEQACAELAALPDGAKAYLHQLLGEAGLERSVAIALGGRFAEIFAGPKAAKADTADLELRLKTTLENSAALNDLLSSANAEIAGLRTQLEASLAQITALEEVATAPAPQPETARPAPQAEEAAPSPSPEPEAAPSPVDPLLPPAEAGA